MYVLVDILHAHLVGIGWEVNVWAPAVSIVASTVGVSVAGRQWLESSDRGLGTHAATKHEELMSMWVRLFDMRDSRNVLFAGMLMVPMLLLSTGVPVTVVKQKNRVEMKATKSCL